MREDVIALFHELVDLPEEAREQHYAGKQVPHEIRQEVESLLKFDRKQEFLTGHIADAAVEMLQAHLTAAEGTVWGPYRIIRMLGRGGMGVVYLADRNDGEVEQRVAIKVVDANTALPLFQERFLRERRILASLNHPGIARLLDANHTADRRPYLVMEYVDGVAIDEYCRAFDFREVLKLFLPVCDSVAYAHRNLIIHRDLKPSNILIDASGQPKLLDFGIAKIVSDTEATQTLVRVYTPDYASPEQIRGEAHSTATDIYSLGAVLYKLLTGKAPGAPDSSGKATLVPASHLNPSVPRDIDFVLQKALRYEPEERYASASAFAGDIQAFLENRPVGARAGTVWYRARKFTRRYWLPVSAVAVAMIGLSAGLFFANRERIVAEQRFSQVRDLSNQIFKLDDEIRDLPGATKARHALVSLSLQYLERLARETHGDKQLALELGSAYLAVARVQGVPGSSNLGELTAADETLQRASVLVEPIVAKSPGDRTALLESAEIAHDRMILADTADQRDRAEDFARTATARLDALLKLGNLTADQETEAAHFLVNVALESTNLHRYDDAIRLARKSVEVARLANTQTYIAPALSVVSNALRSQGKLEEALKAAQEGRAFAEQHPEGVGRRISLIVGIWREGRLLGEDDEVNLNRPNEAVQVLQTAYDMSDQLMQSDPGNYSSRARFVAAARDLADILRHSDPPRALAVYDSALRRSAASNLESTNDRVRLLAGSSYPLRKLNRTAESKQRIDTAFDLLRQMKAWPAASIRPGSEAVFTLRALADYYAETGRLQDGIGAYRDLLDKINASKPTPDTDFRNANSISVVEAALATLERQAGHDEAAAALDRSRRELWQHWDQKLPHNPFVERQLAAIASR